MPLNYSPLGSITHNIMDYCELYFRCDAASDVELVNDILAAELADIGFESFLPDETGLRAYIPAPQLITEAVDALIADFPLGTVQISYTQQLIKDRDWNEVWEQNYFQPVRIETRCLLRAPFHLAESGYDYEIIVNPKMAFGTGNHETTYLMLREMLSLPLKDRSLLDMGCGTAVLAILAAKMGAAKITAIDNDEWAYRNALENCKLNDATRVSVIHGDAMAIEPTATYDYIFANINRNILLRDLHLYSPALKLHGTLFMSGFYSDDAPAIESACRQQHLRPETIAERNNWVVVKAIKD
ncbi:MAG: 50S ribosomal protein L11 methyltransferase [Tannerella sp.]|nr:50S ribosomal protein L11 methyltransferase [Tannerella sp.]